jgi:hypothetical protein
MIMQDHRRRPRRGPFSGPDLREHHSPAHRTTAFVPCSGAGRRCLRTRAQIEELQWPSRRLGRRLAPGPLQARHLQHLATLGPRPDGPAGQLARKPGPSLTRRNLGCHSGTSNRPPPHRKCALSSSICARWRTVTHVRPRLLHQGWTAAPAPETLPRSSRWTSGSTDRTHFLHRPR